MKKFITFIFCFLFLLTPVNALAADGDAAGQDVKGSAPVLMVTDYKVSTGRLTAGREAVISATIKNISRNTDVQNIFLDFSCENIFPLKPSKTYVQKLDAGKSYTWQFKVRVSPSAEIGLAAGEISAQYETPQGEELSSSGRITLEFYNPQTVSSPKIMVTSCETENGFVSPQKSTELTITVVNTNKESSAGNIRLTLSDESGDIRPEGMGKIYIDRLSPGGVYKWKQKIEAVHTAEIGEHRLNFSADYEDEKGEAYTISEIIRVDVRQSVKLSFDGAMLPAKVVEDEIQTVSVNLMNTGKSIIYNCKIDFDVKNLSSGGSVFIGDINPGESTVGNCNLKVSPGHYGRTQGTVSITYEDAFGKEYTEIKAVETVIEKKVAEDAEEKAAEEEKKSDKIKWIFAAAGTLLGSAAGVFLTWLILDRRQRKIDDLRL